MAHADEFGEAAIGLWVRRSLTELTETIERSKLLFPKLGAEWKEQDKMWRFPNGARLRFAYLDNDNDADNYQGHSYTRLYIEEAGNFPSPVPIFKLVATLRSASGVACKIILTGNPGGPGQGWIKERYIDPSPLGWQIITSKFINPFTGEEVERDRVYIPSRVSDNKYLGADYVAGLSMTGSPQLVKAWLLGDFSAILGAFFTNFAECIIEPFKVPEDWIRFRSFDWGYSRPFSVGWWAVSNGSIPPYRNGEIIRYREWYGAKSANVGLELTDEEIARGILSRQTENERFAYSVADPSIFARGRTGTGKSTAEVFANAGVLFRPADNDRILGWNQMRCRFKGLDGDPMVRCFSTCIDSIRTIPALQHDTNKPEDLDTEGEDHAADDWRYGHMSRPYSLPPVVHEAMRGIEKATAHDMFNRHLTRHKTNWR